MIKYPLPGQAPDLFKGFREELGNIEKRRIEKQQRALEMASMIEMADQYTMFGGDYSEAQQMAQWMTDNLDDFADSVDGMIEFRQMAQQLNNFIDGSELYKAQNFGTASAGDQQGSWMGASQRIATGIDPYEKDGFMDARTKESYEMTYMSLNKERKLQFDEQGKPILSQRGRIENPFMPDLKRMEFEGGFEWFEKNSKGYSFPDGWSDAELWLDRKVLDPKLRRRIAEYWAKKQGNTGNIDDLLEEDGFMLNAINDFKAGAKDSFNSHYGEPKPEKTDGKTVPESWDNLVMGQFKVDEMPAIGAEPTEGVIPIGAGIGQVKMPEKGINTGFESFYELKKPFKMRALGDDKLVTGFNIDAFGRLWISVLEPGTAELDEVTGEPISGDVSDVSTAIMIDPGVDTDLFESMQTRMNQAADDNWDEISRILFLNSRRRASEMEKQPEEYQSLKAGERAGELAGGMITSNVQETNDGGAVSSGYEGGGIFSTLMGFR